MLLRALVAAALVRCVAPLTRLPEAAAGEAVVALVVIRRVVLERQPIIALIVVKRV